MASKPAKTRCRMSATNRDDGVSLSRWLSGRAVAISNRVVLQL